MIKKTLNFIIYVFASIISMIVFFTTIFCVNKFGQPSYVNPLYLIGLSFSIFLILLTFTRILGNANKRTKFILYLIPTLIILILQLLISIHIFGASGVDDFDVRIQATNLSFHNYSWSTYFTEWAPQNVGTTIFFAQLLKIAYHIVGVQHATIFINIVVMLLVDLALLSGWSTTKLFDKQNNYIHPQDVFFCFAILFPPIYLTALIMYTDPLSLCAVTFSIYGFVRFITDKNTSVKKYLWIVFASFFAMIAGYLKMNAIILIIAIALSIILNDKIKLSQKGILILILVVTCLLTNGGTKAINSANHFQQNQKDGWPTTYWIAMGLNKRTNGTNRGLFNYPGSLPSKKARSNYENKIIKKEINNTSLSEFINLFFNKICIQWSKGTLGIGDRNYSITPRISHYYQFIMGKSRWWINNEAQIIYILLWFGFMISSLLHLIGWKNFNNDQLPILFIIGIFLFHTFMWEVMSRYAYLVAIPLMIEGSIGLTSVFNWTIIRQDNIQIKYWPILSILLLTIGAGLNASSMTRNDSYYDNIVVGQDFFRTIAIPLKPHESIEEQINVYSHFNRIQLTNTNIIKDKQFSITITNHKHHSHKLSALKQNVYNGTPGQYSLRITNITNQNQAINVLRLPKMDLLQPVSTIKDSYLSFRISQFSKNSLINSKLYWSTYFIILLCLLYILVRGFRYKRLF